MHETILSELAERLRGLIRQDDMIGRGSQTDFLICLSDIRPPESENLLHLAHRLQATLDAPFHHGAIRVYCTISIGIVRARQLKAPRPLEMIRAAERANLSARQAGPGGIRVVLLSQEDPRAGPGPQCRIRQRRCQCDAVPDPDNNHIWCLRRARR